MGENRKVSLQADGSHSNQGKPTAAIATGLGNRQKRVDDYHPQMERHRHGEERQINGGLCPPICQQPSPAKRYQTQIDDQGFRNGDACTRLFMLYASKRRRKLFIPSLKTAQGLAVSQQGKEEVVFGHFVNLLGQTQSRSTKLNWNHLGYEQHNLDELESPFGEEEIKRTIMHIPTEKAPGPDGFIGLFYKRCWPIIQTDLTTAIQAFHSLRTQRLELVNEANVVLIPKMNDASEVADFRPINLINSLAKIITKILADRLSPRLNELVSGCQNAFIRKRCIHDNFRQLHVRAERDQGTA